MRSACENTISIFSGVAIKEGAAKLFEPVLHSWIMAVNEYSQAFQFEDACWWYNERANISILSAAAWKTTGWVAIEEFSTQKHGGGDGQLKNGRCDLYLAKGGHDVSFAIEAKQAWQNIGDRTKDSLSKSRDMVKAAKKDAAKLQKFEAKYRFAACFLIPRFPQSQSDIDGGINIEERLGCWLERIEAELKPDGMAWVFPKSAQNLSSESGKIYPGVCLVMFERKRASKSQL